MTKIRKTNMKPKIVPPERGETSTTIAMPNQFVNFKLLSLYPRSELYTIIRNIISDLFTQKKHISARHPLINYRGFSLIRLNSSEQIIINLDRIANFAARDKFIYCMDGENLTCCINT